MKLEATKRLKAAEEYVPAKQYKLKGNILLYVGPDDGDNQLTFEEARYVEWDNLNSTLNLTDHVAGRNVDTWGFVAKSPEEMLSVLKTLLKTIPVKTSAAASIFTRDFAKSYMGYIGGLQDAINKLQEIAE